MEKLNPQVRRPLFSVKIDVSLWRNDNLVINMRTVKIPPGCLCTCVYMYMYYVNIYICILCKYIYMHVYVCICVYMYLYVYYIYICMRDRIGG